MEARRRLTIQLGIVALLAFVLHCMVDSYICDPKRWAYRPPANEGVSLTSAIFRGGAGTPAIFAMLGGQRYMVASILWTYSDVLFHKGKPYQMVQPLESTVTLNPSFLEAWSVYGWHLAWNLNSYSPDVVMKEKWRHDGEQVYLRALAANPDKPRPYLDLAWLYIQRMGEYAEAIRYLDAVVNNTAQLKNGKQIIFEPYSAADIQGFKTGKPMDEVLERKWMPSIYANRLAYCYKKMGIITGDTSYFEKAIATYHRALELDPTNEAAKTNVTDLTTHIHDKVWLAKQQKDEAEHRDRYGMAEELTESTDHSGHRYVVPDASPQE